MRLSLSVITLKTVIILKLYDLSLNHRQDINGSKIREYIHQVVSFLSQFVATYTPSMFTRSLYNIWTRDLRRETNQSQWTATVKRSRYICFFSSGAAYRYVYVYVYSMACHRGHFLAYDGLTIGNRTIRGFDTVTSLLVKQSILFLCMTVVALCWHSISEVTGIARCIRIFRIPSLYRILRTEVFCHRNFGACQTHSWYF